MLIHSPEVAVIGPFTRISVGVVMDRPLGVAYPDRLWFEIANRDQTTLLEGYMVPFVLGLLFPAMRLREPVVAQGWFSESLFYAMEEIQAIFAGWFPELEPVKISLTGGVREVEKSAAGAVATCFSGGVDSFYTLRRHLHHPSPRYGITHALFALFGPPFHWSNPTIYNQSRIHFEPMLESHGVTLVPLRSNVYDFHHPLALGWPQVHGLITAAAIHLFGRRFSKVFIPSSYHFKQLFPWGSHPITDPQLSTESTQLVHHGTHVTRTDKSVAIADWGAAQAYLNVCLTRPDPMMNCGRCSKCLRTLLTLACTDWLGKFRTFPLQTDENGRILLKIEEKDLADMIRDKHDVAFFLEVLALARKRGHEDIARLVARIMADHRQQSTEQEP